MNKPCQHWSPSGAVDGGACALGRGRGAPSFGVCKRCPEATPEARDWVAEQLGQAASEPTLVEMLTNYAGAMVRWTRLGFEVVPEATFSVRQATCESCDQWNAGARLGLGKCRLCGCTKLKWHLPAEVCPIGKWNTVERE